MDEKKCEARPGLEPDHSHITEEENYGTETATENHSAATATEKATASTKDDDDDDDDGDDEDDNDDDVDPGDEEKKKDKLSSSISTASSSSYPSKPSNLYEPIRPASGAGAGTRTGRPTASSERSRRRLSAETIETLRRERSNNGWGCDDVEADAAGGSIAPYHHPGPASGSDGPGFGSDGTAAKGVAGGDGEKGVPAAGAAVPPDPFLVGWEGGDSDPLCPRSFATWRKWLIIAITSVGSFCV